MTKEEQKIFDIQCESTKKLMIAQRNRPLSEDSEYWSKIRFTPIAKEAQCVKEDGTVDLNVREITPEQEAFELAIRKKRGEYLSKIREEKPINTLTDEKRERATMAWLSGSPLAAIKKRFKDLMQGLFRPSYAEHVAEEMRKKRDE